MRGSDTYVRPPSTDVDPPLPRQGFTSWRDRGCALCGGAVRIVTNRDGSVRRWYHVNVGPNSMVPQSAAPKQAGRRGRGGKR